jgi:hypothetical protein
VICQTELRFVAQTAIEVRHIFIFQKNKKQKNKKQKTKKLGEIRYSYTRLIPELKVDSVGVPELMPYPE